jgi:PIN domain nuclease of toxin-antitoxin system
VKLLLDTQVWLWLQTTPERIRPDTLARLGNPDDVLLLSAAGASVQPVHALRVASLPEHHGDPFDRLLFAQAQIEGISLVTRDEQIKRYDVPTLPA